MNIPRRGRRSGKGEKIRRQQTLHINQNIPTTIAIIATFMDTPRKISGTTSIVEPEEPQEGWKGKEPSSHRFKQLG
jgi:hypothetical protein